MNKYQPTQEQLEKAKALREASSRKAQEAVDSFDRCDTDGFLSQWASNLCSQLDHTNANLLEGGGVYEFEAVFDLQGNYVPAVKINTRYGSAWSLVDSSGKFLNPPVFLPFNPVRASTIKNKGYTIGRVIRKAHAKLAGEKNVGVSIVPSEGWTAQPLEIISKDIYTEEAVTA